MCSRLSASRAAQSSLFVHMLSLSTSVTACMYVVAGAAGLLKACSSTKTHQMPPMQLSRSKTYGRAGLQADMPKEQLVQLPSAGHPSCQRLRNSCLPSPFEQYAHYSLGSVNDQQQRPTVVSDSQLAAELASHGGYQFVRMLPDQSQYGSSKALQVRCSRTNRLRTLLQIPRGQLQQLHSTQRQLLLSELQLASSLHHPHMLQVQEVFLGPLHLNIVMEECSAGKLLDYPAKQQSWAMQAAGAVTGVSAAMGSGAALSPELAKWFFQQLVLAVQYCHAKGVTGLAVDHAMLEMVPSLPQPVVKLPTQLLAQGLPAVAQAASCTCAAGSSDFTPRGAPEWSTQFPAHFSHACGASCSADRSKADVWACGVMLLILLGGSLQQLQAHLQHWEKQSCGMVTLLCGLLQPDPSQRYTVDQILQDPWLKQQLPPAAADMSARFLGKPSTCRQTSELEHLLQLACAADDGNNMQEQAAHVKDRGSAQQNKTQCVSTTVYASAGQLFEQLQLQAGQQEPTRDSSGCITFQANRGGQAVQVVGLALLLGPTWSHGLATDRQPATAWQASDIITLLSKANSPAAAMQLATTLHQLQQAEQLELVVSGSARAGKSSSYTPVLAPVHSMCLDPPMMVLPQPVGGTLQQWISNRVAGLTEAAGASNVVLVEAWIASLPWHLVLQVLCDAAEGIGILHKQRPALLHGGVHAAAVHLLQQLPDGAAAEQQQQQQQQGVGGSRLAQLSLSSLLAQLFPLSSCHPFLCAPEVLLASGPVTPTADVYGFGVLLFQLATGWLPQQYTPGTDEQICAVMWCRDMMSHAGSTSPLAAAQRLAAQQAGKVKPATGEWTPYGKHLPSAAALEGLPAGYLTLMEQCLHRVAAARPTIDQILARLQNMVSICPKPSPAPVSKAAPIVGWRSTLLDPFAVASLMTRRKWNSCTCTISNHWTCALLPLKGLMNKTMAWLSGDCAPAYCNQITGDLPDPVPTSHAGGHKLAGSSKIAKGTGGAVISCVQAVTSLMLLTTVYSVATAAGPLSPVVLSSCHVGQSGT